MTAYQERGITRRRNDPYFFTGSTYLSNNGQFIYDLHTLCAQPLLEMDGNLMDVSRQTKPNQPGCLSDFGNHDELLF